MADPSDKRGKKKEFRLKFPPNHDDTKQQPVQASFSSLIKHSKKRMSQIGEQIQGKKQN